MASDFSLIAHTAQCYTHVLSAYGLGNGLSETGLADSRRAVETENRRLHVPPEFQHREVLDNPLLHLLQSVMVLVKYLHGMLQIQIVLGEVIPRKVQHELQIVVLDAVVRSGRIVFLEFGKLLRENFRNRFRPVLAGSLRTEILNIGILVHTEFLLDGTELIVKVILPLLLVDFILHLGIDFLLDLQKFDLSVQHIEQFHCPYLHILILQKIDLVLEILHIHGRGYEVHKEIEVLDGMQRRGSLLRGIRGIPHNGRRLLLERLRNHSDLRILHVMVDILDILHSSLQVRFLSNESAELKSLKSLKHSGNGSVRHLERLDDPHGGSVREQVFKARFLHAHIVLRHGADDHLTLLSFIDQPHGLFSSYGNRKNRTREDDGIAQCQQRQCVRQCSVFHLGGNISGHHRYDADLSPCRSEKIRIFINHIVKLFFIKHNIPPLSAILSRPTVFLFTLYIWSISVPRGAATKIQGNIFL